MSKSLFRVDYTMQGRPVSSFVVAQAGGDAAAFLGIPNEVPAQVTTVATNVEVVGVDKAHDAVAPTPVNVAPFDLPKSVSMAQFSALQKQVDGLLSALAKQSPSA